MVEGASSRLPLPPKFTKPSSPTSLKCLLLFHQGSLASAVQCDVKHVLVGLSGTISTGGRCDSRAIVSDSVTVRLLQAMSDGMEDPTLESTIPMSPLRTAEQVSSYVGLAKQAMASMREV